MTLVFLLFLGDETCPENVQADRLFHFETRWGEDKVSFTASSATHHRSAGYSVFPSTAQEVFKTKQARKQTRRKQTNKCKQTKTPTTEATETEAAQRRYQALDNAYRSLTGNSFLFIQSYSKTLLYDDMVLFIL